MSDDSALTFPCDIPVKIFGRNEDVFRDTVLEIVRSHYAAVTEADLLERSSRHDNYLSLTVTVRAESRAQIDALYTELSSHEAILMVL